MSKQEDDLRNDLQYRNSFEWAVGHGVSTVAHEEQDGTVTRLETTWIPSAKVYRMKENSIDGVICSMTKLGELKEPSQLSDNMSGLFTAYQAWIDNLRMQTSSLNPERQQTAESLMCKAEQAIARMKAGLQVLETNKEAWTAFRFTNQAMAKAAIQA